ncbi:MAG: hypothetical protein HYV62_03450 [Candidatus Rokubacteria bacterium]|nr:hypothetical protein [Candidatus Rokubacteria bacterium]
MGHETRIRRSVLWLALLVGLSVWAGAPAQTGTLETVAFEDVSSAPPCCAVPLDVVVRAVKEALPGVTRVSVEEAAGRLTVTFDPGRVSRARVVALLEEYSFRLVQPRR